MVNFVCLGLYTTSDILLTESDSYPFSFFERGLISIIRGTTNLVIEDPFIGNNGLEIAINILIMDVYME